MAATSSPLVWDFYRENGAATVVGGVAHYYNEEAQSFWNTSKGLVTNQYLVDDGRWAYSDPGESVVVVDNLISKDFDLDHPYNGTLFGVSSTSEGHLYFLRYAYSMDCSSLISSGTLDYSNSNSVAQLKVNVMNIDEAIFQNEATLFQPGSKIEFKMIVGDEEPYPMCIVFLDSADYSIDSQNVPLSGRNSVGFKLMESTFDDVSFISGTAHEVAVQILEMAGITKYVVGPSTHNWTHYFKANQTLMSGLEQLFEFYNGWKLVELPDGTIVIGYPDFIKSYMPNGYYSFDAGEVFKRKTKRSSDATYCQVRATGKGPEDDKGNAPELTPVTVPVNNYSQWSLPARKTHHVQAPDGFTQSELQAYAEKVAESLQYVGVGEDFTGSMRPQLIIGDIAAVDNGDGTMTTLGIVTSVKHKFGKSGYFTDFSTDSGGIKMETTRDSFITTVTRPLGGYTRKQTIKDLIQVASGSSSVGNKTSGVIRIANTDSNATMLSGRTYEQIIADAVAAVPPVPDELPEYTEQDYGKALVPGVNGLSWQEVSVDSDELIEEATNAAVDAAIPAAIEAALNAVAENGGGSYIAPNVINYSYETTTGATTHSRVYEGTIGNKLLLLIMHRGELTTAPAGWELLGTLTESADMTNDPEVTYIQYVSIFTKMCVGTESISYEQTEATTSMTCFIEFEGISGFEILEATRQENIASTNSFTCARTSTYMAVWVATALYFPSNTFKWQVSDDGIWAISDNHNVQPRLGVFVDNRPAPVTFTLNAGMSGHYVSAVCVQTIPIKNETEDENQGEGTQVE